MFGKRRLVRKSGDGQVFVDTDTDDSDLDRLLIDAQKVKEQRRKGGQRQAAVRGKRTGKILATVAQLREGRARSWPAAARSYLVKRDPAWLAGTDEERTRKVNALVRRLQRAAKKARQ